MQFQAGLMVGFAQEVVDTEGCGGCCVDGRESELALFTACLRGVSVPAEVCLSKITPECWMTLTLIKVQVSLGGNTWLSSVTNTRGPQLRQ